MYRQQGMVVIVPIVLLLGIVAASCTVTLQSVSLMSRFSQHMQQSLLVRNERQQQLQRAAALAKANIHKDSQLALPANIIVSNKAQRQANDVTLTLYEFSFAQQHLHGGIAVLNYPLIRNISPAGLMLFAPLVNGSAFTVTLLPGPLRSLWSPFTVTMSGSRKTCTTSLPAAPGCSSPLLSGNGTKGVDIHDSSADYPASVSAFIFGQPSGIPAGSSLPDTTLCSDLNAQSHGYFVIHAPCSLPAGHQIGSAAKPVLLVILNASVSLATNSKIFGLVVSMANTAPAPSIQMQSNAYIQGAMVISHETTPDSQINIVYDQVLLRTLQTSEPLQAGKIIKGSWRDF